MVANTNMLMPLLLLTLMKAVESSSVNPEDSTANIAKVQNSKDATVIIENVEKPKDATTITTKNIFKEGKNNVAVQENFKEGMPCLGEDQTIKVEPISGEATSLYDETN